MNQEIAAYNPTRERYKHLPECAGVVAAINEYLGTI